MTYSTPDVRALAQEIVAREGGYVDDPDDPGGATKHGVTLGTLQRLGRDMDGNGRVDAHDVQRLSQADAVEIFLTHYYRAPRVMALPAALQPSVFDMYVNAGAQAVRLLQSLLNDMGQPVTVDGVIGAQTASAAQKAFALAPDHLVDAYGIARRNFYFALADRRPASRKYARTRAGTKGGWITRAETFVSEKYRMTEAEFAQRVAAWG